MSTVIKDQALGTREWLNSWMCPIGGASSLPAAAI
jgi:hypothetical protein